MMPAKLLLPKPYKLVLASQSPRRKELLANLGYEFTQRTMDVDESYPSDIPIEEVAEYLSKKKAKAYEAVLNDNELIITADTIVCLESEILGKAKDIKTATQMLRLLSGKKHHVITGVCLQKKGSSHSFSVQTAVYMKKLSQEEMDYYISNYKPFDKAGAYGIQEWIGYIGVEKIEGSFYNVMGLPVKELHEALTQFAN